MYTVISPAKKLNFDPLSNKTKLTDIIFKPEAEKIVKTMKNFSSNDLQNLMGISTSLANLNQERFKNININDTSENKQAILAFAGDVYTGLDAKSLSKEELNFSQDSIGILSGLYGLLRPLDGIQPYRLEMGSKLILGSSSNLYKYWENKITNKIIKLLSKSKTKVLINLASNEYFNAIKKENLQYPIIQPVFKEVIDGEAKIISFIAKKSRGLMTRYIIKNRISNPKDLKKFKDNGYTYSSEHSNEFQWVFLRKHTKN